MLRSKIRITSLTAAVLFAWVVVCASILVLRTGAQEPARTERKEAKRDDAKKTTTQPGLIEGFESVRVFSQVSGFLKKQTVDIGDRVKKDEELAIVDASDLEAQVKLDTAVVDQARAQVKQAKTRVDGAKADVVTAELAVHQAEKNAKSAAATAQYREIELKRFEKLRGSIDEKLMDEVKEKHEAAAGAAESAKVAVAIAKAQLVAGMNKIEQAQADVAITEAGVMIAQAKLERSQGRLAQATIRAPFDGVITKRSFHVGAFIRSADKSNNDPPLFTVQRTDLMRVIVPIPEGDVQFVGVGNAAELEIMALSGKKWTAKVSRMDWAVDLKTGCMVVEMDLPNPTGQIVSGMYCRATIALDRPKEQPPR